MFQLTPETEAPAEMNFFFPDHGWLCTAENCTHTMHNLVPIRGALVRDSLKWSKYIAEMIELFGARTELMFASHHWPRWGNEDVLALPRPAARPVPVDARPDDASREPRPQRGRDRRDR